MEIINIIDQVFDGRHTERDIDKIDGLMVHRCGVDLKWENVLGYDGVAVCNAFNGKDPKWAEVAKAVGYENPYTILIGGDLGSEEYDGVIWQCLPCDEKGPHARVFSLKYLAIGLIADARIKHISGKQRSSLIEVLAALCLGLNISPYSEIKGHGEVDGSHDGSKAPGGSNACPGDLLDMYIVRDDVANLMIKKRRQHLTMESFQLTR